MEIPEGLDLTFEVRSKNFLEEKSKKQKKYKGSLPPYPAHQPEYPLVGVPDPLQIQKLIERSKHLQLTISRSRASDSHSSKAGWLLELRRLQAAWRQVMSNVPSYMTQDANTTFTTSV